MLRANRIRCAAMAALLMSGQGLACASDSASDSDHVLARQVDVVKAVGVVRYFHPHDAVTVVDWNSVLLEGFDLAERVGDDTAFAEALSELLGQFGTQIVRVDTGVAEDSAAVRQCDSNDRPVRWVHQGFNMPPAIGGSSDYQSRRSGVEAKPNLGPHAFSSVLTQVPAKPWRGKRLFFSSQARVPDGGEGAMFIRVEDHTGNILVFDNMDDRRIDHEGWELEGIVFSVPSDAHVIYVGMIDHGLVRVQFRDIKLRPVDEESGRPIEQSILPEEWRTFAPPGVDEPEVERTEDGLFITVTPGAGLPPVSEVIMAEFDEAPPTWSASLVDGSRLQVPLALCPDSKGLSASDLESLARRYSEVDISSLSTAKLARLDVATVWPVIQHFYPYRDSLENWSGALETALEESRAARDRKDHRRLLQRLMVGIGDSHARVYETDPEKDEDVAWLPIVLVRLEGELIVAAAESADSVQPGDRITAIDGEDAGERFERQMALYSGSAQWRSYRAILDLLRGAPGNSMSLQVEREGEEFEAQLDFEATGPLETHSYPATEELASGVFYVNLSAMDAETLDVLIPDLVEARGVVFDLRGYPGSAGDKVLNHLLASPDDWTGWLNTMLARAPDGDLVTAVESGWAMQPAEPHIDARAVFLTDHRAISYAESILGMVKYHDLGTIVGSETAGANGNIIGLQLPGAFTALYTGMRAIGPDGVPIHGRGIEPDIRVVPTIEGLREGRDEVLERALEALEN